MKRNMIDATEIDRSKPIRDWLRQHNAIWLNEGKCGASDIELYTVNNHLVLLQTHANNHGWEVFIPAHEGNDTLKTFEALNTHVQADSANAQN